LLRGEKGEGNFPYFASAAASHSNGKGVQIRASWVKGFKEKDSGYGREGKGGANLFFLFLPTLCLIP
jgi:hypothetical protein